MTKKVLALLIMVVFCLSFVHCFAEDPSARAQKTFSIPGDYQVQIAYSGDNPIYIGYADRGLATTSEGWFIIKITWSGSNPTAIQSVHNAIWDSRTDYTYE